MADALAYQIVSAMLTRIAAIAGIGDTGLDPRAPQGVSTWPACFFLAIREEKEPRTMGSTGGSKTVDLEFELVLYARGDASTTNLEAVMNHSKAVQDALEASPYTLGVTGLIRVFVTGAEHYALEEPETDAMGVGTISGTVTYSQAYGTA